MDCCRSAQRGRLFCRRAGHGDLASWSASRLLDLGTNEDPLRTGRVGDYELTSLLFDGPGYQDWEARHVSLARVLRRIRVYPTAGRGPARTWWARSTVIDNITAINGDDIEFTKEGNEVIISAAYSVKVPLFYNVSLLIDFAPSSAK